MVDVDNSSLQVNSLPKLVGLVAGSTAAWFYIHQMNRNGLCHDDSTINILKVIINIIITGSNGVRYRRING